jgi:osmotically-inducible protein OsmY
MTTTMNKTDSQLKTDVLNELKWDSNVNETEVGVQARDGIVTLTGNISAYHKKLAALDAAHRVFGVLDVVDEMKIRIPSIWERTDQDIAAAVRDTLKWDVSVPDQKIKSTVTSGTVTLEGVVDNWMERYNAEKAINRLTGVKGVINKLTTAAKAIDAAQVKRDIESALERQTEREAKRLGVAVHDGTVTLTGSVRSWGEKNSAERVAWATAGVRHVNDQTTVDPYL